MTALGAMVTGYLCITTLLTAVEADGTWPAGWRLAVSGVFGLASAVSGFQAARWCDVSDSSLSPETSSAGGHPD
jgi:hypothetical protein